MSDTLSAHRVIPANDVNPDTITDTITTMITILEESADERGGRGIPFAIDWNSFRLDLAPTSTPWPGIHVEASVGVLS